MLRPELGVERPCLAGDPDGDSQVIQPGIDVAEADEVHPEQIEQPRLALV